MILVMTRDKVNRCGFLGGLFSGHVANRGLEIWKQPSAIGHRTTLIGGHRAILRNNRRYHATKLAYPWEVFLEDPPDGPARRARGEIL